jgi:hypothetical protein
LGVVLGGVGHWVVLRRVGGAAARVGGQACGRVFRVRNRV